MKKKCKNCGVQRETGWEYVNPKNKVCVFCNDKGIFDNNFKEEGLGKINEPKTIKAIREVPEKKMRFKK